MQWQSSESSSPFLNTLFLGALFAFLILISDENLAQADQLKKNVITPPTYSSKEAISEIASDTSTKSPWSWSVGAGVSLTTATVSPAQAAAMQSYAMTQSMGLGFVLAGFFQYDSDPDWEFEGGLEFSRRQINYSLNSALVGTEHVDVNYFELPLVARYRLLREFAVGGGFYYAERLGGVSIQSDTPGVPSSTNTSATKSNDFGFLINLRSDVPIDPSVRVFFDARFLLGILNINSPSVTQGNTYYRCIELMAGTHFSL